MDAQKLRHAILVYATLAMVGISLVVAAAAIGPLAWRLRADARGELVHELTIRVMAASQTLAQARNLAEQVSSRTVIRERLEQYNRGAVTLAAVADFTRDKLADALNLSPELVGISRFAATGTPVVSVGEHAEDGLLPPLPRGGLLGLRRHLGQPFLVVAAPIRSRDGTIAGTDVVVVQAAALQAVVDAAALVGQTGWAALVDAGGVPRPLMVSGEDFMLRPGIEALVADALASGGAQRRDIDGQIVAAAPLPGSLWVLVQGLTLSEATRQVDSLLLWAVCGTLVVTALGVAGLFLVLRPLTGTFLVHTADLTRQVTQLEQARAELAAKSHALALTNADLQEFAHAASHDLQEPVRTIVAFTQLLKRRYGGQMGAEADEFIAFIVAGAERMKRQINDLLAYTRLDRGEVALHPVSLDKVVDEALEELAGAIAQTGARIERMALPMVRGRHDALVRLMQNLVGNGLKFVAEGQAPDIEIAAHQADGWVEVVVRDHGIGIDPEFHDRIFRMFERLEPGRYAGGGIGLAICRKVADMHGGRLWVESELGAGAAFHLRLPAA